MNELPRLAPPSTPPHQPPASAQVEQVWPQLPPPSRTAALLILARMLLQVQGQETGHDPHAQ